ncbi:MAG: caspase family protein, partial [Thermoplasmatales archaeon]|nr:caspase family protein [Thermoplasmatales archaeon]
MRISTLKIRVIFVIILFFLITASPITNASNFTEIFEYQSSYPTDNQQIRDDIEYYAIIIGIENFIGIEFSDDYIDETASAFYEKLRTGDNWKKDNIKILLNENATKNNIRESILNWLKPIENEDDIVLFYFVGHSNKIPYDNKIYGNAFLLPYDTNNKVFSEDKITDIELDSWFDELESKHMTIIFDTHYSGQMSNINQYGRVILSSSGIFSNKVIEDDKLGYCIFSYYLMKGFESGADNNDDDWVSINEVFQYSRKHSFDHSLKMFFNSITDNSEIFIPSTPSI